MMKQYKIGFSLCGLIAFLLQELPYVPWVLWPPVDNPLANNIPATPLLGVLEQAGGVLTVALLILVVRHDIAKPKFSNRFFIISAICLVFYYVSWVFYFGGITNGWIIVIGLSALVPMYYLFIALWQKNHFAIITSVCFFIGHSVSNVMNYLL